MLNLIQGGIPLYILIPLALWILGWKGVALWKSARFSHKNWFIAILFINTVGLLEIFYIFVIAKKYSVSVEEVESSK